MITVRTAWPVRGRQDFVRSWVYRTLCGGHHAAVGFAPMPHRFDVHDVLVDVEGNPAIPDTEAIHILTGGGFRKLKRVGLGSVNGDLIEDANLEVSFEFFQLQ